jgi:hypothetical protein
MRILARRKALVALLFGSLLSSGCDVTAQVLNTIGLAFSIVDVWV